jgi:uncharacterized membrane protein
MRITSLFIAGIVLLSFAVGFAAYPLMPDQVASHWNAAGEPDAYLSPVLGTFLLPCIIAAFAALKLVGPRFGIHPLRKRILSVDSGASASLIVAFLFFVHLYSLMQNLGINL